MAKKILFRCTVCKDAGLFPFCERCCLTTKTAGFHIVQQLKEKKPKAAGKYDDLPNHDRKRRESQDKYREKTDEEDMTRMYHNCLKVGMSGTGIPDIDDKLFIRFGPPKSWPFKVPRNPA